MIKNNNNSEKRIEMLVRTFIETEMLTYSNKGYGYIKKYFRFTHLGNRLTRKIKNAKSTAFILISKEADIKITIVKGDIINVKEEISVSILKNELCFKKN